MKAVLTAISILTVGVATAGAQAPIPPKPLKTAIVVVKFQNDPADTSGSVNAGLATLHDGEKSVSSFVDYFSAGKMQIVGRDGRRAEVYGPFTIPFDNLATAKCDSGPWASAARAAAEKAGATGYDRYVFAFPRLKMNCGWDGLGGGQQIWLNGPTAFSFGVLAHEIGHTFDWPHAGLYKCTVGGARVALAATECEQADAGDPWDLMGSGQSRTPNSFELLKAGFLGLDQRQVITQSGEYTIKPLQPVGDPGVKMLRIPRTPNSTLDLEFRQADAKWDNFAAGDPIVNGVVVRRSVLDQHPVTGHKGGKTFLVDTNPATEAFNDAPLTPGQTVEDPLTGIRITTKSIGPDGAVVDIAVPNPLDFTHPTPPSNITARSGYATPPGGPKIPVTLNWTAATDNVGVDHYEVKRNGQLVGKPTEPSFVDTTANRAEWSFYDIYAVDKAGNRSTKDSPRPIHPEEPPYAPRVKVELASSGDKVTLDATTRSDIQLHPVAFERNGTRIHGPQRDRLVDTGVKPGESYRYTVTPTTVYNFVGPATTCEVTTPGKGGAGSSSCTGTPLTPAARGLRSAKDPAKLKPLHPGGISHAYEGNQEGAPAFFVHGRHITEWAWSNTCPGDVFAHSFLEAMPWHQNPEHAQPIKIRRDGSFRFRHRAMQTFAVPEGAPEGTEPRRHPTSVLFEGQFHHTYREATVKVTDFHPGCHASEADMPDPEPQSHTYKVFRVNDPTVSREAQ